jgi:hypothetical protein
MSRVEAASGMDRLPWLQDEPTVRPARRRNGAALGSALAAVLLVSGAAFWLGARSVEVQAPPPVRKAATTVRLPAPKQAAPFQSQVPLAVQPQVSPAAQPQVRPVPVQEVRIYVPVEGRPAHETTSNVTAPESVTKTAPPPRFIQPVRPFVLARPWNPRDLAGAAGRVVQIGAFGSVHQSKGGWRYMVRAYPAVAHLPAVVRPSTNSKGQGFYRFQVGTTSQAHSEILCQRMAAIHLSCAVIGLPWKAKVER